MTVATSRMKADNSFREVAPRRYQKGVCQYFAERLPAHSQATPAVAFCISNFRQNMKIGKAGIALIQSFEECRLAAYPDPGTGGEPITIAWGHTGGVKLGDTCTQAEADSLLVIDLIEAEDGVNRLVTVPLTQNQFDAVVSFTENCGEGNLKTSRLLQCLNAKYYQEAAAQFPRWNKSAGRIMGGLIRRREAERLLFLS